MSSNRPQSANKRKLPPLGPNNHKLVKMSEQQEKAPQNSNSFIVQQLQNPPLEEKNDTTLYEQLNRLLVKLRENLLLQEAQKRLEEGLTILVSGQIQAQKRLLQQIETNIQQDRALLVSLELMFKVQKSVADLQKKVTWYNQVIDSSWKQENETHKQHMAQYLAATQLLSTTLNSYTLPSTIINSMNDMLSLGQSYYTATLRRKHERQILEKKLAALTLNDPRLNSHWDTLLGHINGNLMPFEEKPLAPPPKPKQVRPRLTENLSVSLFNGLAKARADRPLVISSPLVVYRNLNDYSQKAIISKINLYFALNRRPLISTEGHCHGIGLTWLRMEDWNLEEAEFAIRTTIASCPAPQLPKLGKLIDFYLRLIDIGQNPQKYSKNTCKQKNVPQILGAKSAFNFSGWYDKASVVKELRSKLRYGKKRMLTISGRGIHKVTGKDEGHTVNAIAENGRYKFFCSNFQTGKSETFFSLEQLVDACWTQIFTTLDGGQRPLMTLCGLASTPMPDFLVEQSKYFNDVDNLLKVFVGEPLQALEEKPSLNFPSPKL